MEYDLNCVVPETGILYFFLGPEDLGTILHYPSDDVSNLVRKPALIDLEGELEKKPCYFVNCGLIEEKNFFGREYGEVSVGLLGDTEQEFLDELEIEDAEQYTFCFLDPVYSPQCMIGAMITNPKKFGKKPFSTGVIKAFISTD